MTTPEQTNEGATGQSELSGIVSRPQASWSYSLDCECPACRQDVNLADAPDFWDGSLFEICEQGTDATTDVSVACPECGHEFNVDFIY